MSTLGVTWTIGVEAMVCAPEVLAAQRNTHSMSRTTRRQSSPCVRSARIVSSAGCYRDITLQMRGAHPCAFGEQAPGEVAADQAGGAGDEYAFVLEEHSASDEEAIE